MSKLLLAMLGIAALDVPPIKRPKHDPHGGTPKRRVPTKLNNRRRMKQPKWYGPTVRREPNHIHPRRLREVVS